VGKAKERKVWVLDTETKGTGAEMVPLDKLRERNKSAPKESRVSVIRKRRGTGAEDSEERGAAAEPRQPPRFKLVNAISGQVVAEGVGAREIADRLAAMRSLFDARVYVWEPERGEWRALTLRQQRRLRAARGTEAAADA
jgi:hypothetical protein